MDSKSLHKANWQLFLFGMFKIPVIGFVRPRVTNLTEHSLSVVIPLRRRTRNHVNSMYLGVMTVGADLACGLLAYEKVKRLGLKTAPVFKTMSANYIKRAEDRVVFRCDAGEIIDQMISAAQKSGERVTKNVTVEAWCRDEMVATFDMGLSFKVRS